MLAEYWWIIPIAMIALCFFMMRGRKGSMMCGCCSQGDGKGSDTETKNEHSQVEGH
ncbi:MAG: hypothetical protein JSV21_01125 [Nitrospirota bacterium]|nr:MAG: hypothetical protein JSV21_01125 [Nitrospirota bacterium]